MGEKKSWRDYSKYEPGNESASGEKTGGWRDYSTFDVSSAVSTNIVNSVNTWLDSYNSYISDYQTRTSGRKYSYEDAYVSDSGSWLDNARKQKGHSDMEAEKILAYMDQYKDYLDKDWMNQVKSTLNGARESQTHILSYYTRDNEWWTSFENEDLVNEYGSAEEAYKAIAQEQKTYNEQLTLDIEAYSAEIHELEKQLEWLSTDGADEYDWTDVNDRKAYNERYEALERDIANRKEYLEQAKYIQGYEDYMGNAAAADFIENSVYKPKERKEQNVTDILFDNYSDESSGWEDPLYEYINGNEEAGAYLSNAAREYYGTHTYDTFGAGQAGVPGTGIPNVFGIIMGQSERSESESQQMTKQEVAVFNYLYETQGKLAAHEFYNFIESDLEGRRRAQEQAYWAEEAKKNPFGTSAFSIVLAPYKGYAYGGQAADMLIDGKINQNAQYNSLVYVPSTIRSQVSTTIENSGAWGKVGSFAYNTGMSMGDFLFTTGISGGNQALSLAIMGTGAAADATLAAKDRGLADDEAFALGTIAGLAEVAMEKISLGAWLDGDMSEGALRYVLNNAFSEAIEETGTSLINFTADLIISGDKSELKMAIQSYIDQGKSEAEAFGLAVADQAAQTGLDALGGFFSGTAIGSGTYAGTSVASAFKYGDLAKDKAYTQQQVAKGLELNPDSQYAQKMQSKLDKGKNLTGMQIRNILAANQELITPKDIQKIQKATEQRLIELGQTEDVSTIAELATKFATGQELTRAERSQLANSKYGSRVSKELLPENIMFGKYTTGWAEEIGTEVVNATAYNKKQLVRDIVDRMTKDNPATYKALDQRVGKEEKANVSKTGKATIRTTGEDISLKKVEVVDFVKDKKTGEITDMVIKANGKKVKASEIDFEDADQSYLYSAVRKIENITPGDATVILRDYDIASGRTVSEYLNGIDEAYTYGYNNYSEADMKAGDFTPKLSDKLAMSAYRMGKETRKNSVESDETAKKRMRTAAEASVSKKEKVAKLKTRFESDAEVYFMDGKTVVKFDEHTGEYDDKRMAGINVAKLLSKMGIGGKYFFYESYLKDGVRVYKDINGNVVEAPNGIYQSSDGSIYIDLNAGEAGQGTVLYTMAHELLHFVKDKSEKQFKILSDLVTEAYSKTDMSMHERVLAKQKFLSDKRGKPVSYNEAKEEVVADAMSTMLSDGSFFETLIKIKAKDKGLFNTIKRFFEQMIAKFKKVYAELTPDQKDAQDIRAMKDMFDKLQTAFAEALVEASENFQIAEKNTTEDGGVDGEYGIKLSPREENAFKQFAKAINAVVNQSISGKGNIDGKAQVKDIMPTGPKITAMVAASSGNTIDISQRNIALSSSDVWHEYKRHTQEKQEVSRGQIAFTKRQFQNAVKCIISPDIVETIFVDTNNPTQRQSFAYAKKTARGHYVVVEAVGGKKNPQIYPVLIVQFNKAKWNKMMAEGKSLGEMLHEGEPQKLLAQDVERNKKSRVTAAQFASYEAIANTLRSPQLDTNVSQQKPEVKKNSDRDSKGNQLSKEQQEFFKDSTVRDENGNLRVVYHGTRNANFTVFKRNATYFTDNKEMADSYSPNGDMYEGYVNITKPYEIDAQGEKWSKIPIDDATKKFLQEYGASVFKEGGKWRTTPADLVSAIEEAVENGDMDYDGIIIKNIDDTGSYYKSKDRNVATDYIVFNSNQFKNADNKAPTSNPDIRYSYRGTNKDGVEVYETSPAILTLSWQDRKAKYLDIMRNDYRGRTARFSRNGHIYYAQFDQSSIRKHIYGDKRSSPDGVKALIKAGADGDVFDLVENSQYSGSLRNSKNHTKADYFDYFVKTVQIDGKVFDLVADVEKIYGDPGGYVYTLALVDNKKIKASPALGTPPSGPVKGAGNASTNTVAQNGANVNKNSERGEGTSNRDLLANAFESVTKDSDEYKIIQEYKGRIRLLNEQEEKLAKLNAEIRKITFGTEGERDYKKPKELQAKAKETAKLINKHDKKLLSLEASEPLKKVIEQERKKEAQKTKEHIKEIQQNKKTRAEQTELRHKIRKTIRDLNKVLNRGNKKQNVKEGLQDVVSKALAAADVLFTDHYGTYDMLRNGIGTDLSDAEEALVASCAEMLNDLDAMPTDGYENWQARQAAENKLRAKMSKLKEVFARERKRLNNATVSGILGDLADAYKSLENSEQSHVKGAYTEPVYSFLVNLREEVGGTIVKDMTKDQLESVYQAYKMVLHSVRKANELFIKGKTESVDQMAERITKDFSGRKMPKGKVATVARNIANKIGWSYEKLYYALDRIGSEAFTELVMNLANSENTVMQDVMEAAAFRDDIVEKYGFNNWDVNKELDRVFLDTTGKEFKLTLGQLMALYAYSRRAGAWDHIEYGGFVFDKKSLTDPKPADSYKLTKDQCEAITDLLTKEQKAYVEEMQKFLSETMGAKGNEVSMLLYGIKMFKEENYFPIHVAGQFKAQASEAQAKEAAGFASMSNAGFTHAQNPNAKAPFVLESFNEVWADHVNEMSRYHGTVPALEDMRRVMNRSTYFEADAESMSIKQLMENSFGKEAVDYFDSLYREANSGAIRDKLERWPQKLLSRFRKNSVAYSLSVLIQQPASLVRAYALVDKKHFGFHGFGTITSGVAKAMSNKWTKAHTKAYNEMLKYAPGVTMAKEIGGFDTATGGSIRSYLLDTKKSFVQSMKTETLAGKGKAVLDKVDNNAVANLPNLADKIAWVEIWNACKRETVATRKDLAANSEEFMQAVGERFTEVIRATQVYDSIFAKSPMLKSKSAMVQTLVSFMNEPNAVANMVESAVRDAAKGNWKQGTRKAAVVIHSVIFTAILKSIIYAMRDDDEDETYIEKYIEALTGSLMDDFNALNYIPFARDVWSVAQGYDVERSDMAIVADAINALNGVLENIGKDVGNMTEDELVAFDKKVTEANWKLVESAASFFGIPIKNIRREINGVINHAKLAYANAGQTTTLSAWDKVYDAVVDSIPFISNDRSKSDKLYNAIVSGDKTYANRLKSTYKTDDAYNSAVRKALRENDPRIYAAAQARIDGNSTEYKRIFREIQNEGNFTFDEIMGAVNSEVNAIKNGLEPDKVTSSYTTNGFVEAIILGNTSDARAIREDIISTHIANGKTKEEAEKEFMSDIVSGVYDAYSAGLLNDARAKKMLMEYAGKDEDEAASKVSYWAFCEKHPKYKDIFTESHLEKYNEFGKLEGISVDVYAKFITGIKGLSTKYDQSGDVESSKRDQVLEVIDSLPLTWQQKDALYLAAGYSESKIWDVPW